MQMKTKESLTSDKSDFIAKIIETSIRIVESNGLEYLKLSNVSYVTGYSKSHIYNYFGNRLGILDIVIEHLFLQMKTEILNSLPNNLGFAELFITMVHRRKDFILKNKVLESYFKRSVRVTKQFKDFNKIIKKKEDILFANISSKYYETDKNMMTYIGLDFWQIWTLVLPLDLRNKFLLSQDNKETEQKMRSIFNVNQGVSF